MHDADWHGTYLTEDEIVADMLAKIKADPEGVRIWTDPRSWHLPLINGRPDPKAPEHAGSLVWAGMLVRNYYGLWHESCPITKNEGDDLEVANGVITDPRFADNVSKRIIERVRKTLQTEQEAA